MITLRRWPAEQEFAPKARNSAAPPCTKLVEVFDRILDRGLVIDCEEQADTTEAHATGSISLLGIPLITAKLRAVVHDPLPYAAPAKEIDAADETSALPWAA